MASMQVVKTELAWETLGAIPEMLRRLSVLSRLDTSNIPICGGLWRAAGSVIPVFGLIGVAEGWFRWSHTDLS
jgi:hypothetical protein